MAILTHLHHVTRYTYDRPVALGPHVIRLRPAPHTRVRVSSYTLSVKPDNHFVNWQQDPLGNWLARYLFPQKATELVVTVDLMTEIAGVNPFDFFVEPSAETYPFAYSADLRRDLAAYVETEPPGENLLACLSAIPRGAQNTVQFLVDLNRRVHQQIAYVRREEAGVQSLEETLGLKSGSCRDSGWLLVQLLRHLGLAARFVSGYLIQLKPEETGGIDRDDAELHAWAEVYVPGAGWIGLDPTSGLLCGEDHIPLAATPHYATAAPITGSVGSANVDFSVEMTVSRLAWPPHGGL
jgi:transglutaminase-like putative cysteine protease